MPTAAAISLFVDGACENNPGPGGWAALLRSGTHEKLLTGGCRLTTNNRMELTAVIEGLRALKPARARVVVYSDSRYVVQAVNEGWLRTWLQKGFRKGDGLRENADLWFDLDALLVRHDVTLLWIEGHAGHAENERCDEAAVHARKRLDLPADAGFESPESACVARGLTLL